MNDNGDEDDKALLAVEEEIRALVNGVKDVITIMEQIDNPHIKMQILASCASFVLCTETHSAQEANHEFRLFQKAVDAAVRNAVASNTVFWPEGPAH